MVGSIRDANRGPRAIGSVNPTTPPSPLVLFNLHFFSLIYVFLLNLLFPSPYFDHDAFVHHALHVLDTPGQETSQGHGS